LDHHVADLTGEATSSTNELSVRNDPATDSGAKGHHNEVGYPATDTPLVFGKRRAVRVVLTKDTRVAERRAQLGPEVGTRRRLEIRSEGQVSVASHHARKSETNGHVRRIEARAFAEFVDLFDEDLRRRLARAKSFVVGRL
jgi:hypothetical protein